MAVAAGCATIVVPMSISGYIVHAKDTSQLVRRISMTVRPTSIVKRFAQVKSAQATAIPPLAICSGNVNVASLLPGGAHEDSDVAAANAFITLTEDQSLQEVAQASSLDLEPKITLLVKTEIYDVNLSPLKNIACATCHVPYTGFRGATSIFNATTAAQPGGIPITNATPPEPNWRLGPRNPQTYAYAPFAPILHYNATQNSFYGGNFWDMRATGIPLGNPAAGKAEGPPGNPGGRGNIHTA